MKDYTVWLYVREEWKVSFQAKDLNEAKQTIIALNNDSLDPDDVDKYEENNKGLSRQYDLSTLEEFDFPE